MLFLQFVQYSSSFVGTPKNEIPGAALELCQLKIKQFSPETLKFSTKHEDNLFTLNCYMVPRTFLFIFHAGSRRLRSNNFRNSSYKEKTAGSARVSRLFPFLMTMNKWIERASTCLTILTGTKCCNKWIYKNRISAASDFCAHNQLKFHNSIAP